MKSLSATEAARNFSELLDGVELADAAHRPGRKALLDSIIATVPIEDYDLEVARSHGLAVGPCPRGGAGVHTTWSSRRPRALVPSSSGEG
jgi:hypothetical protein